MDFYGAVVPRAWVVILLSFLAAYYGAHYLGQAEFSYRLFSYTCSGGTWLSASHSFAMCVSGLMALGLTLGYAWLGGFSGVALRQDHKGGSVKAAAFLLAMFSIGMSLFLLPCESQSTGEGSRVQGA